MLNETMQNLSLGVNQELGEDTIKEQENVNKVNEVTEDLQFDSVDDAELLDQDELVENNEDEAIQKLMDEVNMADNPSEEEEELNKAEEQLLAEATYEPTGEINVRRQYDERHRTVSLEAKQLINDAGNPLHFGVLDKYRPLKIEKIGEEDCLIMYIPDPITGVKGILPKKAAGLRGRETLEYLMRLPFIRVTPIKIDDDGETCVLSRELAERIAASKTWRTVHEGQDVEAVVRGFRRNPITREPQRILLDIGGVQAFLDRSEISHNYVAKVDYRIGDIIKVRVIMKREVEVPTEDGQTETRRRFYVSVRAMQFNPWSDENLIPKIREKYNGVIQHVSDRFVHVELQSKFSVICPRPSLNYLGRDNIVPGREIPVYISGIDRERRIIFGNLSKFELERDIRRRARQAARRANQTSNK